MRQQIKRNTEARSDQRFKPATPIHAKTKSPSSLERRGLRHGFALHSLGKIAVDEKISDSNRVGLPDRIKHGIENLSGVLLEDVRVHYRSPMPAQMRALAYTQGTDIYVAPGQEKHLAHEAWHVVQQQEGRVRPTMRLAGTAINDDSRLEQEADSMGAIVARGGARSKQHVPGGSSLPVPRAIAPIQMQGKNRFAPYTLGRRPFSSQTQRNVPVKTGEHRRHIISHHLMKNALQAWWDSHKSDAEGAKTSPQNLQSLLDEMNNHTANLIPGLGTVNSALGMLAHQTEHAIPAFKQKQSSPLEISTGLSSYRGFQQNTQRELTEPVYGVFSKDPVISASSASALEFAEDISYTTDFDWPGGTSAEYEEWFHQRQSLVALSNEPNLFDFDDLEGICDNFLKLQKPSGQHG